MSSCALAFVTFVAQFSYASASVNLRLDADGGSEFPFDFWTAAPMTDRNLESNVSYSRWLVSMDELKETGELEMLSWNGTGAPYTNPLTDTMSTVRLLGGWASTSSLPIGCLRGGSLYPNCTKPHCCQMEPGGPRAQCCNPIDWSDAAYRVPSGGLGFRWDALFDRLDPVVNNSINPVMVLDNVDYAFVTNKASIGKYGQNLGPDNATFYAEEFIAPLMRRVVERYGADRVRSTFWFRVGTEPNTNPGHWNDTAEAYVNMYVKVREVILREVGQGATVGPGNFCPFYIPGVACNASALGNLNTSVGPIVSSIAQQSGFSFLAGSFYGGNRNCPQAPGAPDDPNDRTIDASAGRDNPPRVCGFDPEQAALSTKGLIYLRNLAGKEYQNVPLQFQEYGILDNSQGRISPGPGAFGGAWTLATSVRAAAEGLERAFHWGFFDLVSRERGPRARLYYAHAWVSATLKRLFGSLTSAAGRLVILSDEIDISPPRTSSDYPISAYGIGAEVPGGVGLFVSAFSPDKYNTDDANITVRFRCPASLRACGRGSLRVQYMLLDRNTSTYNVLYRDAAAAGWLQYNDSVIYGVNEMLTPEGIAALGQNETLAKYLSVQKSLFESWRESPAVSASCDGDDCQLNIERAQSPSVYAVRVNFTALY